MAECQRCTRTDLNLTQNGRVKTHCANGKRVSPDNPHCPGGSDWPREHVRALAQQGDSASAALLMAWGEHPSGDGTADNRPTAEDVRNAELVMAAADTPADIFSAAEEVLYMASTFGVQGSTHTHTFEHADDGNGHSGSFCACGEEEGAAPAAGPNPHRRPVPTGWPEAQTAGWSREEWDAYNQPGGALQRLLGNELEQRTGDGAWQATAQQTSQPGATTGGRTSAPSSSPGTTASAASVTGVTSKETSSEPTGTGVTSMPTAPKTGSPTGNTATDFVNGSTAGDNDVPRDRWGRYLLPHPVTGRQQPWTRTTTLAKSVADTFALSMWQQRMAVKGITLRPDLYALASGYDVSADKDDLNSVCEQARNAAGDKVAANLGTAMHNFTARVDKGEKVNIPLTMQSDVDAYVAALAAYGLRIVPHLIERRVTLTRDLAGEDVAGTFDRVYEATRDVDLTMADKTLVHLKAGDRVIGDLKTGRDLGYGWGEIAIQETIYAHAINQNGVWDPAGQVWETDPVSGSGAPGGAVREDVGIVVHLPIQKKPGVPACTMWAVDLAQGWEAVKLCVQVRKWRKARKIASQLDVVDQPQRPAAVPAPVVDGDAAEVVNRRSARELAEGKPQAPASGYDRPTAAQVAGHPSVARETAAQAAPAARKPTWEERADAVSTRADASAIYQEMRPQVQTIGQTRFSEIVKRMQKRLNSLVEQGG
jgi:hypothetical protein